MTVAVDHQLPSQGNLNRKPKKIEGGEGQGPRSHMSYLREGVSQLIKGLGPCSSPVEPRLYQLKCFQLGPSDLR